VQFTQNVADRILDPHIRDAEQYDYKPTVPDAFWSKLNDSPSTELSSFLTNYVKPLLVFYAYKRFLLWQGRNVTQISIVTPSDDTSSPISDKARGEIMNDIQGKIQITLAAHNAELDDQNYTFDSVVYDFTGKKRQRGIRFRKI